MPRLTFRRVAQPLAGALFGAVLLASGSALAGGSLQNAIGAYQHGNFVAAAALFAPLAHRGNRVAQAYMGLLYEAGRGVPQNFTQAAIWFRRAADQGHPGAQYKLGLLYDKGQGVPEDPVEAEKWLILATAGTNKTAADDHARIRDAVRTKMTRGEIAQARMRALEWGPRPER
jgi:TPR repeat protein